MQPQSRQNLLDSDLEHRQHPGFLKSEVNEWAYAFTTIPGHKPVLVFWGEHFDEIVATTCISILRRRSLRVFSVGPSVPTAIGQYGVMITADRVLGQTLSMVAQVQCLIVPCDTVSFL